MTVSAIEFSRIGPPKLRPYGMRCNDCGTLHAWWERFHCYSCGSRDLVEQELEGGGEVTNYTVVYYPPREFLDLAVRMREMVGAFLDETS